MTACRAARLRRARWTSCCRLPGFPKPSPRANLSPSRTSKARRWGNRRVAAHSYRLRLHPLQAGDPAAKDRAADGMPPSASTGWSATSNGSGTIPLNSSFWRKTCSSMSQASFAIPRSLSSSRKILPDLIRNHAREQPLRPMGRRVQFGRGDLFPRHAVLRGDSRRGSAPSGSRFSPSDIDADAVALAREGFYPRTIEAEVSPERFARFFSREEHGYRIGPDLRAAVVFTVQNVLADPPFSRLDMISCRNLLIYLGPQAQEKVVSLFHFAPGKAACCCSGPRGDCW